MFPQNSDFQYYDLTKDFHEKYVAKIGVIDFL